MDTINPCIFAKRIEFLKAAISQISDSQISDSIKHLVFKDRREAPCCKLSFLDGEILSEPESETLEYKFYECLNKYKPLVNP